jgi:gamma-glutamyltranspeptidase/glutathione hydrolase
MRVSSFVLISLALAASVAASCSLQTGEPDRKPVQDSGLAAGSVDLSPARWDEGELERLSELTNVFRRPKPLVTGRRGLISGTVEPLAVRSGLEALKQGGSAVDAALTASLAQIALLGGSTISYAGVLTMVYYDAATGEVHALDAGFNTVLDETDPLTIPAATNAPPGEQPEPIPRGRAVLVPGFMAGVQAAHDRFGMLPFDQLFAPSIYFAEEGVAFTSKLARYLAYRKDILTRLPETKAIFTGADGNLLDEGDVFRQPALAETLRAVAREGAAVMYSGEWADRFVEAVRRDGGRLTKKDLEDYRIEWRKPLHVSYNGYDIHAYHEAVILAGMMNLIEAADLASVGHYTESPESFYWFTRIFRAVMLNPVLADRTLDGGVDSWLDKETAERVWKKMQAGDYEKLPAPEEPAPGHSAAVVAVDEFGNVAAVLHSINTVLWGESGIFVGGVSVSDAAGIQVQAVAAAGPGRRLRNLTSPLVVTRDGKPVMAVSCIGTGIYPETPKVLLNVLGHGRNVKEAIVAASFLVPSYTQDGYSSKERVFVGAFPAELLEKVRDMGIEVEEIDTRYATRGKGSAVALAIDPETGIIEGCAPPYSNGATLGY